MSSHIPEAIKKFRRDLSGWLWHFCRRDGNPLETLRAILESGYIRGGTDRFCQEVAVCLTETPLTESIRQSGTLEQRNYARLSDYGLGFCKEWVFSKGGLPVIYQPAAMRLLLPEEMRWRHCDLDYTRGIDFTWQREWRVPAERLEFTHEDDVIVVVRTESEAGQLLWSNMCIDDRHDEIYVDIDRSYVTHEMLTEATAPHEIEVLRTRQDR